MEVFIIMIVGGMAALRLFLYIDEISGTLKYISRTLRAVDEKLEAQNEYLFSNEPETKSDKGNEVEQ